VTGGPVPAGELEQVLPMLVLAFAFATGATPAQAEDRAELMRSHLSQQTRQAQRARARAAAGAGAAPSGGSDEWEKRLDAFEAAGAAVGGNRWRLDDFAVFWRGLAPEVQAAIDAGEAWPVPKAPARRAPRART
jgi:hypothetical protein